MEGPVLHSRETDRTRDHDSYGRDPELPDERRGSEHFEFYVELRLPF